jgi:hypothetical protein
LYFGALFPRLVLSYSLLKKKASSSMSNYRVQYELRCRECGRSWGNQPRSICDDCFSALEITYDYDSLQMAIPHGIFTRERISQRPPDMWRYAELLPLPEGFEPRLPVGFTPLIQAPGLAKKLVRNKTDATIAAQNLYIKNDAVCRQSRGPAAGTMDCRHEMRRYQLVEEDIVQFCAN